MKLPRGETSFGLFLIGLSFGAIFSLAYFFWENIVFVDTIIFYVLAGGLLLLTLFSLTTFFLDQYKKLKQNNFKSKGGFQFILNKEQSKNRIFIIVIISSFGTGLLNYLFYFLFDKPDFLLPFFIAFGGSIYGIALIFRILIFK
ncbi:MAG: hypothetical protein IIA70_04725 [Proteobacteria bacterium]|nr:hypothetical protein [Pseudomonadota bacterium]